ncbi:MAG: Jag N-terminal domain-containing protein [Deltaproteobacteria bacterium]
MPIVIERAAKTVSEAAISVCEELGLSRDEIEVEVIEEGSKGIFGIGSKNARVRVRVKLEDITEIGLKTKKALEELLGFFSTDFAVSLRESPDRINLDVKTGDDKAILIGRRGEMLRAVEFLMGRISGRLSAGGEEKRISLDIGGYKKRREEAIIKSVKEAARRVRRSGRPVTLEPMSSFERKIAYSALKRESNLKFDTKVIEGDEKRIIISPARDGRGREPKQSAPLRDE